jgi:hypothetical protein
MITFAKPKGCLPFGRCILFSRFTSHLIEKNKKLFLNPRCGNYDIKSDNAPHLLSAVNSMRKDAWEPLKSTIATYKNLVEDALAKNNVDAIDAILTETHFNSQAAASVGIETLVRLYIDKLPQSGQVDGRLFYHYSFWLYLMDSNSQAFETHKLLQILHHNGCNIVNSTISILENISIVNQNRNHDIKEATSEGYDDVYYLPYQIVDSAINYMYNNQLYHEVPKLLKYVSQQGKIKRLINICLFFVILTL